MRYYKITNRISKIIGLEAFVFASFIGICFLINALIVNIPAVPTKPGINFLLAALKVGLSFLFVGIWLVIWYIITKRLMKTKKKTKSEKSSAS
ncbi:MAG: hypothetical protein H7641_14575 [Candidatus Heimdallarchaeota archaeon]|nr:hypothetical protein [Candidatus Heimdallarchaeota archaeon]MCK4878786.1 hypothetical protein [Candidatus Heimdallarchaeota archaeon]